TRSSMLDVLREDYVRTARAKGLASGTILRRHVLRPAMVPVITIVGVQLGTVLAGSVVVETAFNLPGLGRLLVDSVSKRDYPVVQALILFYGVTVIIANWSVDISYGMLDP